MATAEHEGRLGVLRCDVPGYSGRTLEHLSWEHWFGTFDARHLRFPFQERKRDGSDSNCFRLEHSDREGD